MSSLICIYTVCRRCFKTFQPTTKAVNFFVIGALRVNKCEFIVYGRDFHEMYAPLRCSNNVFTLYHIINIPS